MLRTRPNMTVVSAATKAAELNTLSPVGYLCVQNTTVHFGSTKHLLMFQKIPVLNTDSKKQNCIKGISKTLYKYNNKKLKTLQEKLYKKTHKKTTVNLLTVVFKVKRKIFKFFLKHNRQDLARGRNNRRFSIQKIDSLYRLFF